MDREKLPLRRSDSSLALSFSLSPFVSSLLDRLLDDFMPHKNDIKFVKTERCNDRTAWPYGVGVEEKEERAGVARGGSVPRQ